MSEDRAPHPHAKIVAALGGYRKAAGAAGAEPIQAAKWAARGIPFRYWHRLVAHGVKPAELEAGKPVEEKRRPRRPRIEASGAEAA